MKLIPKNKKKFTSILIVGTSVLVSLYLIFGPNSSPNRNSGIEIIKNNKDSLADSMLSYQSIPLENLTLDFANKTFQDAINNNLYQTKGSGPSILPPNASSIDKTISDIIDKEYASEVVTSSDITVGTDNSNAAQMLYLLYVNRIVSDIPTFTPNPNITPTSLEGSFSAAASNFDTAINLLKIINVPPSWIGIHQEILTLLTHQRNVFQSLASVSDDPLRFMTALYQMTPDDQFAVALSKIQSEITQKITDEKLI